MQTLNAQVIGDFSLNNLENEQVSFDELRGEKLTVIDFWATWCKPCTKAMPKLNDIYQEFKDQGVEMIGISCDGPRSISKVSAVVNNLGVEYPILKDINCEIMNTYQFQAFPTLIIINEEGKVVYVHEGFKSGDELKIKKAIEENLSTETEFEDQINITNLAEGQFGKLPNESADPFPSIYDRLQLSYSRNGFNISSTIEQYHTTFNERGYVDLSQFAVNYKKKQWDIKVGNFYETLGKGVLLRSFEFPGALLEDFGFRSRTYFHRDLLGASAKYTSKKATFQILHADALNNTLPPTFDREDRRTNEVTSASAYFKYADKQEAGLIFMHFVEADGTAQNFLSGQLNGTITQGLEYFGEYARDLAEDNYALFAGLSGFKDNFSYSLEYRNYQNFSLGAGINEPPAGVKQQTYRVLNRSIHVSDPFAEEGYQIDLFYNFSNESRINLNHSFSKNPFGSDNKLFKQYFLEYQSMIGKNIDYRAFLDYSQDPLKGEDNRYSVGLYSDISFSDKVLFSPEVEYQTIQRLGNNLYNFNVLLGLSIDSKYNISVLGELTDDPFLLRQGEDTRFFLGGTFRYNPNYNHTFQLFYGERRGGPACSAGVCYEILDRMCTVSQHSKVFPFFNNRISLWLTCS